MGREDPIYNSSVMLVTHITTPKVLQWGCPGESSGNMSWLHGDAENLPEVQTGPENFCSVRIMSY